MLAKVRHQPFKARISLEFRRGYAYSVKAGAEVARQPLGLVTDHLAEEVQGWFGEPAAKIGPMKTMYQIVGVGRWLQPGAEQRQGLGERFARRYAKAAEAIGDGG